LIFVQKLFFSTPVYNFSEAGKSVPVIRVCVCRSVYIYSWNTVFR